MKTSSAKAKGRRLQQWTVDQLLETFLKLTHDDVRSTSMGASGSDVQLSTRAKELIPLEFECKNTERFQIWSAFEQAESNCGDREPCVIAKRNGSAPLAIVDAEWLMTNLNKLNWGVKHGVH